MAIRFQAWIYAHDGQRVTFDRIVEAVDASSCEAAARDGADAHGGAIAFMIDTDLPLGEQTVELGRYGGARFYR